MEESYSKDKELERLCRSLNRKTIVRAWLEEDSGCAVIKLSLDDERIISIGVCGNLYDEAHLVFESI